MTTKREGAQESVAPNLIPMVDIMFLLLLFFMLGADMGQRELEAVRLPEAAASVDHAEPRLHVNVYHAAGACPAYERGEACAAEAHWAVAIRGEDLGRDALRAAIAREADLERTDPAHPERSERRVMIRADRAASYGRVQEVIEACTEAGIYRVEIGAARPPV